MRALAVNPPILTELADERTGRLGVGTVQEGRKGFVFYGKPARRDGVTSVEQLIPFLRWQRRLRTCQRDPGDAWPRHGIFRGELLFLVRDGGDLDCLEGLRLAERVLNIPSLHDPLRQEANPEPTERGAPSSEPRSGTGRLALGVS